MIYKESLHAIECALQAINSDLHKAADDDGDYPSLVFRSDGFSYCVELGLGGQVLLCSESGRCVSDDPGDDPQGVIRPEDVEGFLRGKLRDVLSRVVAVVAKFDNTDGDAS